uniref:EF-hand domain-containing protein n=1 Tax=Arcella intermedia TaxID=1963864 RepID=A0A6B2L276_9EUKA
MKEIYGKKMLEIERRYRFEDFHAPVMRGCDFDAKPMVLLLGQYSVGKTSFIEYILKRQFPGERVGPEPTTDRFIAVMYDKEDQIIPGNALSVDIEKPFHGLNAFGNGFLTKFEGSLCNAEILERITFVDTPGILSGEKQRLGRSYDFAEVTQWFVQRSDMILLLFDAHKLDISDEFKSAIELLKGNEEKVRVVLNKADQIGTQQLMRVYGALMWSLGKVIKTPEVLRVYIGSFWDQPYHIEENKKLFEMEQKDLIDDLLTLPRNSAVRKINELVKRTRLVRTHAAILSHLKEKMPMLIGKESTQIDLIKNLQREFMEIQRIKKIPPGDFPDVSMMQQKLQPQDFSEFPKESERLTKQIEQALSMDLPQLMKLIQPSHKQQQEVSNNPFAEIPWEITPEVKAGYDQIFFSLAPKGGSIPGHVARDVLMNSGIGVEQLRKIWELSDFEKNGTLDNEEFALALHLTEIAKNGGKVPNTLPASMVPLSKRNNIKSPRS